MFEQKVKMKQSVVWVLSIVLRKLLLQYLSLVTVVSRTKGFHDQTRFCSRYGVIGYFLDVSILKI